MSRPISSPPKMTWPGLEYLVGTVYWAVRMVSWLWSDPLAAAAAGVAVGFVRTSN